MPTPQSTGLLEFTEGRYPAAHLSLQKALALAETLGDAPSLALTERNLANLYGRQQNIPQAQIHADRALEHYQRTGDRYGLAIMLGSLASIYLDNRQFAQAAKLAAQALEGSKAFPYFAAIAATNLAEALFELGELERAQKHAYDALHLRRTPTFPLRPLHPGAHQTPTK
ncbi:MAG: tetratricopeptide repeat protein [Caldilineaceae bacterium]